MIRPPVSHEDIADRLDRGDVKFTGIEARLAAIEEKQDLSLDEQETIKELLQAWMAAQQAGDFIIWVGKLLAAWAVIATAVLAVLKLRLWTVFGGD